MHVWHFLELGFKFSVRMEWWLIFISFTVMGSWVKWEASILLGNLLTCFCGCGAIINDNHSSLNTEYHECFYCCCVVWYYVPVMGLFHVTTTRPHTPPKPKDPNATQCKRRPSTKADGRRLPIRHWGPCSAPQPPYRTDRSQTLTSHDVTIDHAWCYTDRGNSSRARRGRRPKPKSANQFIQWHYR